MTWLEHSTASKTVKMLAGIVRYWGLVLNLVRSSNPALRHTLLRRPQLFKIVAKPFLTKNWDAATRVARVVDHFDTASGVGRVMAFRGDEVIDLIQLTAIDPAYRLTLDQPVWLLFEGPAAFSLWEGIDRIFHISFCLSSEGGRRIAYIGGIQGRNEENILDRYRKFTKAAFGMRPRDFLVEAFRSFCASIGVEEIKAISDEALPWRDPADRQLSYDSVWCERGGTLDGDGFYRLTIKPSRRADEEIPSKRRSQYRQRYAALDAIEQQLRSCVGEFQPRSSTDTRAAVSAHCVSPDAETNARGRPEQKRMTLLPLDR